MSGHSQMKGFKLDFFLMSSQRKKKIYENKKITMWYPF